MSTGCIKLSSRTSRALAVTDSAHKPLVSVVMPAYNCEAYVEQSLRSVLEQPVAEIEIIVVDDASTDNTLQIIERLAQEDTRIRVIASTQNSGQGACRNRGVGEARGRYLAFLDSDDLWLSDKLERQLDFLKQREIVFCFCGYGTIDENDDVIITDLKIPGQTDYLSLLKSNTICPSSVVYDRELLGDIIMPERPRRREDLISWLNVSKQLGGNLYGIPEPLCMVRRMRGSSSSNKLKTLAWQWAVYRDIAGFGLLRSLFYLGTFAITSLAKRSSLSVGLKPHKK